MALCSINYDESLSIEDLRKEVAMESIYGTGTTVLEIFGRLIPKSTEVLQSFISPIQNFVSPAEPVKALKNSEYRKIVENVKRLSFIAYADTLVMVPEGFKGSLDKYIGSLINVHQELIQESNTVLKNYTDELGIFLNNVDYRKSIKSYEAFYSKIKKQRLHIEQELQSFFKKNDNKSRARFGDVVSRFGEMEELFAKAEKLQAVHGRKELSELITHVTTATSLLALIKEKIDTDKEVVVSSEMVRHLSEGAYEAAKYVELVSISCFNIEVALNVVETLAKQFSELTA